MADSSPKRQVLPSATGIVRLLDSIKSDVHNELVQEVSVSVEGTAIDLARAFVVLRIIKDKVDETFKEFDELYLSIKDLKIPEKFDQEGVPTINLDEGYRVTVAHSVRAHIRAGMKDAAYQWLRDNQLGELVTETVNASTLSAVARSLQEENRELDETLFGVAIMPTTSVTKVKGKA